MAQKKHSRLYTILIAAALVGAGLAYAFWPRPVLVDIGTVRLGPMSVTIDEEGRTRVHNAYVVSTPITGRLLRVDVEPGDLVQKDETVVARMLPTSVSALDIRTREQAQASVTAAEAALRVAQADLNKAMADRDLEDANLDRTRKLFDSGIQSQAALEQAQRTARAAIAALDTARAAISIRIAELDNARARLISFDDPGLASALETDEHAISLYAPITGRILKIDQQSETTLSVGTPIMEIGNVADDLEIVVELLSTDAVQVQPGARVIIDNWGGPEVLEGLVETVEPWGFTKYSALGVEEQRVNAKIRFTSEPSARRSLGHGYRVEAQIVVWEKEQATIVPASSLFRDQGNWAVFAVDEDSVIRVQPVTIEANNGIDASVAEGLAANDQIVLYPSADLLPGTRVAQRLANGN